MGIYWIFTTNLGMASLSGLFWIPLFIEGEKEGIQKGRVD